MLSSRCSLSLKLLLRLPPASLDSWPHHLLPRLITGFVKLQPSSDMTYVPSPCLLGLLASPPNAQVGHWLSQASVFLWNNFCTFIQASLGLLASPPNAQVGHWIGQASAFLWNDFCTFFLPPWTPGLTIECPGHLWLPEDPVSALSSEASSPEKDGKAKPDVWNKTNWVTYRSLISLSVKIIKNPIHCNKPYLSLDTNISNIGKC